MLCATLLQIPRGFVANDSLDWIPKLRASYFVDVRSPREGEASTGSIGTKISAASSVGSMSADTRPFEEIKRMRLSQALDSFPPDGGGSAMTPSPTFTTCARPPFECARSTPRFSPGKGMKVSGFKTTGASCRPAFGGGGLRDKGFGRQPPSPALTAPPTPPSSRVDWKAHDSDVCGCNVSDGGGQLQVRTAESDQQGVLPMEQRPLDEVNAVQALMSVGLGARPQAAPNSVPEEEGDTTSVDTDSQTGTQGCEVRPKAVQHARRGIKVYFEYLDSVIRRTVGDFHSSRDVWSRHSSSSAYVLETKNGVGLLGVVRTILLCICA